MTKDKVKSLLRQSASNITSDLKSDLNHYLGYFNEDETIQVLTQCAMLASKHGILPHLQLLIETKPEILKEQQCGIFRVSAEIEHIEDFKKISDYLFQADKQAFIDVNTLNSGFLKECIKRDKLEYIQYLVEDKKIIFNLQNIILIKTLLRYDNSNILNYFIVDLKVMIDDNDLKTYMLENEHTEAFDKIQKCNMFMKLANKLEYKNTTVKVKKI